MYFFEVNKVAKLKREVLRFVCSMCFFVFAGNDK